MQAHRADAPEAGGLMGNAYDEQWRELRFRTRLIQWAGLLYLPGMLLSVMMLDVLAPGAGECYAFLPLGVWAALLGWLMYRQISFRCPHCGGWFGSSGAWASPIARRCLHCGQKRYEAPGEGVH